jgi:hypothetical protein
MAYIAGGLIQASDYNNYVGTDPSAAPNRFNTVYGMGSGRSGYGQIPLPLVATDAVVSWGNWNNLISGINSVSRHQNTIVPTISINESEIIEAEDNDSVTSAFETALTSIYNNRNNCAAQGATISATVVKQEQWNNHVFFSHTITFDSGDAARHFFNAGGQIAINFTHPSGTGINTLWNNLTRDCGTVVISSPVSGTTKIAGVDYSGVTRIGGSGAPTTLTASMGYYNLNTTYREVFKQKAAQGNYKYLQSFISVNVKTNGTRGSNGDVGNVITIVTKFDQVPDGHYLSYGRSMVSSGSAVTVSLRPPSTAYIANTWGNPLIIGNVLAVNSPNYQGYTTGSTVTTLPGGAGEALFTNPGVYTWRAPIGVTSVHAVAVGGGGAGGAAYWAGGGGGGGGLGWKNNIPIVPGNNYTVVVGAGGVGVSAAAGGQGTNGGDSYFINSSTVAGFGGTAGIGTASNTNTSYAGGIGGSFAGDGGGRGGDGGSSNSDYPGGGGGAGGYSGTGGRGGSQNSGSFTGGLGGGSAGGAHDRSNGSAGSSGSGGGTGLLGSGNSGSLSGQGGSNGSNGSPLFTVGGASNTGGFPGGGGGGQSNDAKTTPGCNGGHGAVRLIWSGSSGINRAFPNTNTDTIIT